MNRYGQAITWGPVSAPRLFTGVTRSYSYREALTKQLIADMAADNMAMVLHSRKGEINFEAMVTEGSVDFLDLVLTMQGWIDLDASRSPLLEYRLPEGDEAVAQMSAAVDAFGLGPLEVTPEEMDELGFAMIDAISTAFGMRVSLRAPWEAAPQAPGGFGSWLSILACLIAQIGMSRIDALACPVAQAFALIATHRFNQGWQVVGDTYAQRDALVEVSREEEHSGRMPEWAGKMPAVPTTETEEEAN